MSELVNEKSTIQIEVLTPLSIGAGSESDWAMGIDFVVMDGNLYRLNLGKMKQEGINIDKLSAFFADKNAEAVLQIIGSKLNQVSDLIMPMPCSTDNDVKAFITNQLSGRPIIPGSSLKGSIRSVLFSYFRENDTNRTDQVFGSLKFGTDFMRFVRVSDFEFEKTALVNTKIYNLFGDRNDWQGGWKHKSWNGTSTQFKAIGFNTVYECLMPGEKAVGSIMIAEKLFDLLLKKGIEQPCLDKKQELLSHDEYSPIENLFYEINNHTFEYLKKERAFFNKYNQGEHSDRIIQSINGLMNKVNDCIDDGQSCILKMAAGSGFHSITGDWQYDDYSNTGYWQNGKNQGKKKYKSRKIAVNGKAFTLMGFVKMSII